MGKAIVGTVYPSTEITVLVIEDDVYGGAHDYLCNPCFGFINGASQYDQGAEIQLPFVKKNDDGTIRPGLQSEQLALILIDRAKKLNARFPSAQNAKMIAGLEMFLEACKERVDERIQRGVMGELKA